MIPKTLLLYFIFSLLCQAVYAQPSRLGIFEATADWGWEREYAPEGLAEKVPGRVEVSETQHGNVYDVWGNGAMLGVDYDNIGYDLGYYVYSPQTGSTQFTAKVKLIERGGNSGFSMSGIMIRKNAKDISSENYTLVHRFGTEEQIGIAAEAHYRYNNEGQMFWGDIWNTERTVGNDTAYLRLTNIQPLHTIASEISLDGHEWFPVDQTQIELGDRPAYGLVVCSRDINQQLAHSQFTEVNINPVQMYATRQMKQFYMPGQPVEINLTLVNETDSVQQVNLKEHLPDGWVYQSSSHTATALDSTIHWNLLLKPGQTSLSYMIATTIAKKEPDKIYGHINNVIICGHHEIYPIKTEIWGTPRADWRYWDSNDGLLSLERELSIGLNGSVMTRQDRNNNFIRYDGYEFQIIPAHPHMQKIVENKEGRIWSIGYELNSDAKTFDFYGIYEYLNTDWQLLTDEIGFTYNGWYFNFFPVGNETILIGTITDLVTYNTNSKKYESISFEGEIKPELFFPQQSVQTLDGAVWIGGDLNNRHTFTKLTYMDKSRGEISFPTLHPFQESFSLRGYDNNVATHHNGMTITYRLHNEERGVAEFNGDTVRVLHEDTLPVKTLLDTNGSLWLSKENHSGLQQIDQQGNIKEYSDDFFVGGIHDIHIAPKHGFWVATHKGIAFNSPAIWQTPPEILGLNESVYSITEDNLNRVWFLSSHHLIRKNENGWTIYQIPDRYSFEDISGTNNQLIQLQSGVLSIGPIQLFHRWKSIQRRWLFLYFDPEQERFIERFVPESMKAVAVEKGLDGSVIEMSKPVDLNMYNHDDRDLSLYSLHTYDGYRHDKWMDVTGKPNFIYLDSNGSMWTASSHSPNALYQYKDGITTTHTLPNQAIDVDPLAMIQQEGHWIIATGDCIFQFDGKTFNKTAYFDGLKHDIQLSADGSVWIASDGGLLRYQKQKWYTNGSKDGLLSSIVYAISEDSQGNIWAGTASGLSLYQSQYDQSPPETNVSTEINIDEFTPNSEIVVSYTGFDKWKKTDTNRLLYSTKLNQSEWSSFSSSTVFSATGLQRGNHTLFVRSMDRNGNIDITPAEFGFSVQTPWYLQAGFLIGIGFLLTILIFRFVNLEFLVRLRTTGLKEEMAKRQKVEGMVRQVSEREQKRIGQEIHDSLCQTLAGISFLTESLLKRKTDSNDDEKDIISLILENANQATDQSRRIARSLYLHELEANGLKHALYTLTQTVEKLFSIPCRFECTIDLNVHNMEIATQIFRTIQEAIANAAKHSQAKLIILKINETQNQYVFQIIDDGIGFDKKVAEGKSMGMNIMLYRTNSAHAQFEINSIPSKGTTVTIILPKEQTNKGEYNEG